MKIESLNYPDPAPNDFPPFNDPAWYFRVHVTDIPSGLRFRFTSVNCVGPGFDNVFIMLNEPPAAGYFQEFENPNSTVVLTGTTTGNDTVQLSGGGSGGFGNFTSVLEIETGAGTDEYIPLTTAVGTIEIQQAGDPFAVASDYDEGPGLPDCFWTDTFLTRQYDCVGVPDIPTVTVDMLSDTDWHIDPASIDPVPDGFGVETDFLLSDADESASQMYLWNAGNNRYEAEITDGPFGAPTGDGCFMRQDETEFPVTIVYNDLT